jgi:hypothetical protein
MKNKSTKTIVRRNDPLISPLKAKGLTPKTSSDGSDNRPEVKRLLKNIKAEMPGLEKLLKDCSDLWGYEDPVYRFYHQSFKVFHLQEATLNIVARLQSLLPDLPMNDWFIGIVKDGTGKTFKSGANENWLPVTRPIIEAFFHARFFLEMAVKYGRELDAPPRMLPSGWAALLYLFNLR